MDLVTENKVENLTESVAEMLDRLHIQVSNKIKTLKRAGNHIRRK